jgi:hypothetical protein
MTTDKILQKANIALEVLLKYSELDSKISLNELMDEIVTRWNSDI